MNTLRTKIKKIIPSIMAYNLLKQYAKGDSIESRVKNQDFSCKACQRENGRITKGGGMNKMKKILLTGLSLGMFSIGIMAGNAMAMTMSLDDGATTVTVLDEGVGDSFAGLGGITYI